ncbi:hypothetical protein [Morganella psychrotolerans]|uniref:hypothetical protein n=1 Tax=Morganella psychrotolerans TaxID=368603 RepID=UPI0039B027AC
MRKITVSTGNLGNAGAADYVSFNIWQGKHLLLSDQMTGKHSGVFHREYDVDYIQGEPLRIESNAPEGCSVGVSAELSDAEMTDTNDFAVFNSAVFKGILDIKGNQIFMREVFIDKAWLDGVTPKTTEQRISDLEKQLADMMKSTSCGIGDKKDAYSVLVSVEAELSKLP